MRDDLKPGPIRHQQLPPSLIARIEALRSTLEEVYPQPMAAWLEGFQRDADPEQEVEWWERLARCYVEYKEHRELQGGQKKAAFGIMFKLTFGARVADLAGDLASLPSGALDEIVTIIKAMYAK